MGAVHLTQQQTVLSRSNKIHLLKAEPWTVYRGSFVTRRRGLAGDKGDASTGQKPIKERNQENPSGQAHAAQRKHRAQQSSCHFQCHRCHTALRPDAMETPQRSPTLRRTPINSVTQHWLTWSPMYECSQDSSLRATSETTLPRG